MPMRFLFFCLLFTFLLPYSGVCGDSSSEVSVLVSWAEKRSELLSSVFVDWKKSDSSPCEWSYLECSSDGFVTRIDIQSVDVNLPFPAGFSSLLHLQTLIISGCNLTGTIPDSVGEFSELQVFDVSSNSISGAIPAAIGKLQNLKELVLNSNQLTGSIPAEIGSCVSLKTLVLFDNFLSGELPVELGNLSNLEVLRAGGNAEISGNIPAEIGMCQNLQVLGLADTKVSGAILASIRVVLVSE